MIRATVIFGFPFYEDTFNSVLDDENPADIGFVRTNSIDEPFRGYFGIELAKFDFQHYERAVQVAKSFIEIKEKPEQYQIVQGMINALPEKFKILVEEVSVFVIWDNV